MEKMSKTSLNKFITYFDIFGRTFNFTLNRNFRFKSIYGGITSIIFFILSMVYFVNRARLWISRENLIKNFHISSSRIPLVDIDLYKDFMLVNCISSPHNFTEINTYSDEILNHTLSYIEIYRFPFQIEKEYTIPISNCKKEDFPRHFLTSHKFEKFSNCKCLSNNKLKQFQLRNYWTEDFLTELDYRIKFKDYVYKDKEVYEKGITYLKKARPRVLSFFIENFVNLSDDDNPFLKNLKFHFDFISVNKAVITDVFLSEIEYLQDSHLMIKGNIIILKLR